MDASGWVGIALGAWGAGLSSYLGYRALQRDRPTVKVSLLPWTESTPLEERDVVAGVTVSVTNVGLRPIKIRDIWFEQPDGSAFGAHGPITDHRGRPSAEFGVRLEDGDEASYHYSYRPWMKDTRAVRVNTAGGGSFTASESPPEIGFWVVIDALLRLDEVAKALGMKPGHDALPDPVDALADHGIEPAVLIKSKLMLDRIAAEMQRSVAPEVAVAQAAIDFGEQGDQVETVLTELARGNLDRAMEVTQQSYSSLRPPGDPPPDGPLDGLPS